jgi:predicted nucleotidyltransferase
MIYTIKQIKELVEPIAQKYKLKALWVFGSYARGEATDESDVDFLMDDPDLNVETLLDLGELNDELEGKIFKHIHLITTDGLFSPRMKNLNHEFIDIVIKERVLVYGKT